MTEVVTIHERFEQQNQDLIAERVVAVGQDRVKAYVRRNSYDSQSYATVSVWTAAGWDRVATLPWDEVVTRQYTYVTKGPAWTVAADVDLGRLVAIGVAFLEGAEARVV